MTTHFKCESCDWKGSGEEAMKPDEEVAEDWRKIWDLRKSMEPGIFLLADEQGLRSGVFPGTFSWENEILQTLVCPKCAGEAARVSMPDPE